MAITEGRLAPARNGTDEERLIARCGELARGGIEFLLVREKRLEAEELASLTRRIAEQVRGSGMRVILAGAAEIALTAGADGVHLAVGKPVAEARKTFAGAWVSISCHRVEEVQRARAEGADAVLFAPVFGKTVDGVEVAPCVGLEALREACVAAEGVPVFALGGVDEANTGDCMEVGASGVAGIRMFFSAGAELR